MPNYITDGVEISSNEQNSDEANYNEEWVKRLQN